MTWPGEGLLIRFWETIVEKGIGGFLSPWQIKREATARTEARCREIVAVADAERNAEAIRSGRLWLADRRYVLVLLPAVAQKDEKELEPVVEITSPTGRVRGKKSSKSSSVRKSRTTPQRKHHEHCPDATNSGGN
jgi:hypothetical protein